MEIYKESSLHNLPWIVDNKLYFKVILDILGLVIQTSWTDKSEFEVSFFLIYIYSYV